MKHRSFERFRALYTAGLAILGATLICTLILLLSGHDPLQVYALMLENSGLWPRENYSSNHGLISDFTDLLDASTPLLFAAMSVAIAYRAGMFNVCVSGQMLAAGFMATVLVGYSPLTPYLAKPLVLLIGFVVGGAIGATIGYMKARLRIHEIFSAIMINYIIQYLAAFFIKGFFFNSAVNQTQAITPAARLTLQDVDLGGVEVVVPLGFGLAVILAVVYFIIHRRTRLAFEIRAVGASQRAAQYAGIDTTKTIVLSMTLSGCAAGLAGVTLYLGNLQTIAPDTLSAIGLESFAPALLANANPLVIIATSLFVGIFTSSGDYIQVSGVGGDIASLYVGLLLAFWAAGWFTLRSLANRRAVRRAQQADLEKPSVDADAEPPPDADMAIAFAGADQPGRLPASGLRAVPGGEEP